MIIKIPYTDGEHTGCAKAPDAIIEILKSVWGNSDGRSFKKPEVKTCTIDSIIPGNIYLGGDHTITYYTVKEFVKNHSNVGFIVFDAHPDVFQAFDKPTHQDYLKFLIEEKILRPENIIVIGTRAAHPDEIKYYEEKRIKYYKEQGLDLESVTDGITEFLQQFDAVYLSIDMDIVDPAFAPGVSYIEPSGLTSRELMYFVNRLKQLSNLKAIDLVEVNPENDINGMTVKLAAKIIAEFL